MTKEAYFEMCEMLGQEVNTKDIPVEYSDLPEECQTAIQIYTNLSDIHHEMSGSYTGKSLLGLLDLFSIYEVEQQDRRLILSFIETLDALRKKNQALQKGQSSKVQSPE